MLVSFPKSKEIKNRLIKDFFQSPGRVSKKRDETFPNQRR